MTTITHKSNFGNIRRSMTTCREAANDINAFYGLNVKFYGRNEYNATGKSYVIIPERDEIHEFESHGDAYMFLLDLDTELTEAEFAAC